MSHNKDPKFLHMMAFKLAQENLKKHEVQNEYLQSHN
jgi:hypothetical protein